MDKTRIELLVRLQPEYAPDGYADSIVEILTPPGRLHPIKRYKFYKTLPLRIRVVYAEYAKELINAFATTNKKDVL